MHPTTCHHQKRFRMNYVNCVLKSASALLLIIFLVSFVQPAAHGSEPNLKCIPSTTPEGIIASDTLICAGDTISLVVYGGQRGENAQWVWYTGSCGETYLAYGDTIQVSPDTITTYFVRIEGEANITECVELTIDIKPVPFITYGYINPLMTGSYTACLGDTTELFLAGPPVPDAEFYWYAGECGGNPFHTGNSPGPFVSPSATTTYYARAENECGVSDCISGVLHVYNPPAPGPIIGDMNPCPESLVSYNIDQEHTDENACCYQWTWPDGISSPNPAEFSGVQLFIGPDAVSGEICVAHRIGSEYTHEPWGCVGPKTCAYITIAQPSVSAVGIMASDTLICTGDTVSLAIQGGTLGNDADWFWYEGACGENMLDSGSSSQVWPETTTSFFVRAEGKCNTTDCAEVTIGSLPIPVAPFSVSASDGDYADKILISWESAGDASGYIVYRDNDSLAAVSNLAYSDFEASCGIHTYYVYAANSMCFSSEASDDSGFMAGCGPVALNDRETIGLLNIYPNPADNFVMIQLEDITGIAEIRMIDALGKSLDRSRPADERNITIDLSMLNPGIYLLQIIAGEDIRTEKIIIER
jgi:hypothetical protein